jgi:prephenate dehydrogenase
MTIGYFGLMGGLVTAYFVNRRNQHEVYGRDYTNEEIEEVIEKSKK